MKQITVLILLAMLAIIGCKDKTIAPSILELDKEALSTFVSGFPKGEITRNSPLRIRFAQPATAETGATDATFLQLSPKVAGTAVWEDEQTLVFTPAEPWAFATRYTAEVKLSALFNDLPADLDAFSFQWQVQPPQMDVEIEDFRLAQNGQGGTFVGVVNASDVVSLAEVKKLLSAKKGGNDLPLTWDANENGKSFRFSFAVDQSKAQETISLTLSGNRFGQQYTDQVTPLILPTGGGLQVISVQHLLNAAKVRYLFSKPLDGQQELAGLVGFENTEIKLEVVRSGNSLEVFYPNDAYGSQSLKISGKLRATDGSVLNNSDIRTIEIVTPNPEVRMVDNGVILSDRDQQYFSFEAVNLSAVEVEVIQIFNNNLLQFLQQNDLRGESELRQVGRIIHRQSIDLLALNEGAKLREWNLYAIDIAPFTKKDPEAIYKVSIGFRPEFHLNPCGDGVATQVVNTEPQSIENNQNSLMDMWSGFNDSGNYYYSNYRDRDDACKRAYYNSSRFISKNLIVSNIGLVAKVNDANQIFVAATNLETGEPAVDVALEFFDYQQQKN